MEPNKSSLIDNLPGFSFEYYTQQELLDETKCFICFENYCNGMIMQMLPCNHIIHRECLLDWNKISKYCPICRDNTSIRFSPRKNRSHSHSPHRHHNNSSSPRRNHSRGVSPHISSSPRPNT